SEMRMFAVADQRSIPEIEIDTVIAVPCRELLLTEDVRDRAAALSAEHPPQEHSVPGSVPDMLARLAEGIPVEGMEALLPLLKPEGGPEAFGTLSDHLPEGTPLLVCDPEKVRSRAADLIKTGREFLEASWSTAAVGGDVPIDIEALGASGYIGFNAARDA
ncbi:transcription-repair coupling factor, partial [Mycobacterium sp. ITM-2017-0098]